MIKDNQKSLNRSHVLLDALVIVSSYVLAWYLIIESGIYQKTGGVLPARVYFIPLSVIVPLYLILYGFFHLYTPKRVQESRAEFANICKANSIGLLILLWCCIWAGKIHIFSIFPVQWC